MILLEFLAFWLAAAFIYGALYWLRAKIFDRPRSR